MAKRSYRFIRFLDELGMEDVPAVGGKNASLGEMYRALAPRGVLVPNGFAITSEAYRLVLEKANGDARLHEVLDDLDPGSAEDLERRGQQARDIVYGTPLPAEIREEALSAYHELQAGYPEDITVAVRSSATAEDLPGASFAGQHDTYLNVEGDECLLDACRRCFASLFTDRAIHYRADHGFDQFAVALSVGVMKMVRSDLASSGVMFSLDTESGFRDVVFITGAFGLGDNVVQGTVDPDEFYVHKPTFEQGHRAVLRRTLGRKQLRMICAEGGTGEATRNVPTPAGHRERFCISDSEVLKLADYAIETERHYSALAGHETPMDMEWAKDGTDGKLYLIQARPETVFSRRRPQILKEHVLKGTAEVLAEGRAVGNSIACGVAHVIASPAHLGRFKGGEILVADSTTPDWEPVMKKAAAIVTQRGGRTCHAAIVARELGIPAVVGAVGASERVGAGQEITVCCAQGERGRIFRGVLPFEVRKTDLGAMERPVTKVMINVGNPELAFRTSMLPNDGVGLARMEFIISAFIKVHPMALLHPDRVEDPRERDAIALLTRGYATRSDFFVEKLSEGIGTIAAAFHPKPVIVRMSDFKTNEYAQLLGGKAFEPPESNPMLGFRGASRYAHPAYAGGFALECAAIRRVRDEMGLKNTKIMIPFCRRVEEGEKVIGVLAEQGLRRGEDGLEIHVMCEIPNNVVQVDAFSRFFDGFSIGSNDLTQLVLGVDRDSEIVSFDYDERDAGVLEMIRQAVEGARRNGRHSGICGQAPSDYPEIAEFLVRTGIDSISLNPDSVLKTTLAILEIERELRRRRQPRTTERVSTPVGRAGQG